MAGVMKLTVATRAPSDICMDQPPVIIGGAAPAWSTHEPYLVTSKTAANSFCPHGHVRIGSLF